jgi:hypothetical protein
MQSPLFERFLFLAGPERDSAEKTSELGPSERVTQKENWDQAILYYQ